MGFRQHSVLRGTEAHRVDRRRQRDESGIKTDSGMPGVAGGHGSGSCSRVGVRTGQKLKRNPGEKQQLGLETWRHLNTPILREGMKQETDMSSKESRSEEELEAL